jgi:beta-galactosidase
MILVLWASPLPAAEPAPAENYAFLEVSSEGSTSPELKEIRKSFDFASSFAAYGLNYNIDIPADAPEGKCTSGVWAFRGGNLTLGMGTPTSANWYTQSFLKVQADGISLHDIPGTFRVVRSSGPDALFQGTWPTEKGPVHVRVAMRGGDDKLLVQISLPPESEAEKLRVRFTSYPQGFSEPRSRAMATATRELEASAGPTLDADEERWALFYDKRMAGDPAFAGPCAFAYVPDEVEPVKITLGSYAVSPTLQTKPGERTITVALWDFTPENDVDALVSYLREGGPMIADDLAEVAKADWLADPLPEAKLPARRREHLVKQVAKRRQPTPYDEMTREVVTPHIPWARPLAGGPIRTLVVAPRWLQREVVELAQRLDMQYRTVPLAGADQVFDSWSMYLYDSYDVYGYVRKNKTDILADFSRKLAAEADCIVVSGVHARTIPDTMRQRLLDKVRSGSGLMLLGCAADLLAECKDDLQPADWAADVVPAEQLPRLDEMLQADRPLATAYRLGKGRVLVAHWATARRHGRACFTPLLSHEDPFVLDYYDYYHSLVASAMLWAAGRTMPVAVEIDAEAGKLALHSQKELPKVTVDVLADSPERGFRQRADTTRPLPAGRTEMELPALKPKTGSCLVSVRVLHEGKCLGWATGVRKQGEALPHIEAIDLAAEVFKPGEAVQGQVRLTGVPDDASVEVELLDALSRRLAVQKIAPEGPAAAINLPVGRPVSVLHEVRARLYQDGELLDQRVKSITVPQRDVQGFHFLAWTSADNNAVGNYMMRQLARHGVDWIDSVGLTGADRLRAAVHGKNAARWNLKSIPYSTRIHSDRQEDRVRKPCLTNPGHMQPWAEGLTERAEGMAPYGPVAYTLGDENYLIRGTHDVCTSPTCLARFREELKSRYGSLEALNASWKTDHKAWDEIVPETLDDVKEKPEHWPRWADHRMYMDRVFTAAHAAGRDALRRGDPNARVGFDGVFSLTSYHGYNFYDLCRTCDLNQVYSSRFWQLEYIRCWHQDDSIRGAWYNRIGNRGRTAANRIAWHLLLHQHNSSWYWTSYHCGPALLFPDLRPTPQLQWMQKTHAEIRGGIDKLLLSAERLHDGIAVHYSQPSVHAGTLQGHNVASAQWGFALAVEDLGMQYDMLSNQQIEEGALEHYRALLLPGSTAISPAEAKEIKAFVRRGGLLIADRVPAVLDDHCRPLPQGQLDELFAVRSGTQVTAEAPEGGPVEFSREGLSGKLPLALANSRFEAAGAVPWATAGEAQAVLVNNYEEGTAVLLNARIDGYDSLHATEESLPVLQLLGKLMESSAVRPRIEVDQHDTALGDCEVVVMADGAIRYVALLKEENCASPKPSRATVTLAEEAEVYDVRAAKYLGRTGAVDVTLQPGDPTVLACLPNKVESLALKVPERVAAGASVSVRAAREFASDKPAGKHCLRFEWFAPDGSPAAHYTKTVLSKTNEASAVIDLALNDRPGTWKVLATDVATGTASEATIEVIAAE